MDILLPIKELKAGAEHLLPEQSFSRFTCNAAQLDGKGIIVRDFEQLSNTTTFSPAPSNGSSKTRLLGLVWRSFNKL